jgi:hypothetical protein
MRYFKDLAFVLVVLVCAALFIGVSIWLTPGYDPHRAYRAYVEKSKSAYDQMAEQVIEQVDILKENLSP